MLYCKEYPTNVKPSILFNKPDQIKIMSIKQSCSSPSHLYQYGLFFGFGLLALLLLAACTPNSPIANIAVPQPDPFNGAIDSIANYALPTPVPTTDAPLSVVVSTQGARANVRSGPGTSFPIIGKATPGQAFEVVSKSGDNTWWEVCCLAAQSENGSNQRSSAEVKGWIAASVVRLAGEGEDVAISKPLFDPELTTQWQVDWQCGSERCEIKECSATVAAKVSRAPSQQMLSVEHEVTWEDKCFDTDSWVFEINQYTGQERSGEYKDNFLYSYWLGSRPGAANGVFKLDNGQTALVYCSGPHKVEIEEGGGWTTVYEGNTCHDIRTGMLVYLSYNKQWLFTGEHEGEKHERAYFGDFETLEQKLVETNVELLFVKKRR
jgi:hypothetical protein